MPLEVALAPSDERPMSPWEIGSQRSRSLVLFLVLSLHLSIGIGILTALKLAGQTAGLNEAFDVAYFLC